jgi:hypothetical protein
MYSLHRAQRIKKKRERTVENLEELIRVHLISCTLLANSG